MDDFFIFPIECGKNDLKANFKTTGGTQWILEKKMNVEPKRCSSTHKISSYHVSYIISVTKQSNLDQLYHIKLEAYTLDTPKQERKLWKRWTHTEKKGEEHKNIVFEVFSFDLTSQSPVTDIPRIIKLSLIPVSLLSDEMLLELPDISHPSSSAGKVLKKLDKLSEDMEMLLTSGNTYDVVLTADEFEVKAHKIILSSRSSVFARMFANPMKENLENKVVISNLDRDSLQDFVFYIYTGRITLKDHKKCRDLFIAADLYDLPELRDICSAWLKFVTFDSAVDSLRLGNDYDDQELKEAAMTFIAENSEAIKATEKWALLMQERPPLALEMLSYMFNGDV